MTYLTSHESLFTQKTLKTPSAKVNSQFLSFKDSIIEQNVEQFQVKVKCYNLHLAIITE